MNIWRIYNKKSYKTHKLYFFKKVGSQNKLLQQPKIDIQRIIQDGVSVYSFLSNLNVRKVYYGVHY